MSSRRSTARPKRLLSRVFGRSLRSMCWSSTSCPASRSTRLSTPGPFNRMKRLKAAAVQIAPDLSGSGTVDRVCAAVEKAAAQGVELAVFPETLIPYYPYFSFVVPPVLTGKEHLRLYEQSIEIPGPVTARLAQSAEAARMVLVVGVNERDGGTLYNTQLVFDSDGSLVLRRRKITPSY